MARCLIDLADGGSTDDRPRSLALDRSQAADRQPRMANQGPVIAAGAVMVVMVPVPLIAAFKA